MAMKPKLHVKSGDTVEVTAGNARGARGRILRAMPSKGRVVVEGLNLVWKHIRPSSEHPRGGRIQIEAPIHASNVALICPNRDCASHDRPVRVKRIFNEAGRKVRVCARCGAEIPTAE